MVFNLWFWLLDNPKSSPKSTWFPPFRISLAEFPIDIKDPTSKSAPSTMLPVFTEQQQQVSILTMLPASQFHTEELELESQLSHVASLGTC